MARTNKDLKVINIKITKKGIEIAVTIKIPMNRDRA